MKYDLIGEIENFIKGYFENNMKFDSNYFMNIFESTIANMVNFDENTIMELNVILSEVAEGFAREDYYFIVDCLEHDLLLRLKTIL